jgi:RNA polymerase sigma factor (sigma-70 family)
MGKQPQTLAQALASLPEEERIILTMHYLKSMSAAEIASILGVPERSVDAVIRQGKSRLSAILGI